ncbi:virulence RhuM family protein [Virgibacillus proomii]|nr:virulence RhuM family protein [Virgibacillus proomii]
MNVTVAKKYLNGKRMRSPNCIVTMYLDYADNQVERINQCM